jgi:hypothetical protein
MDNSNCGEDCAFVKSGFCKCDKECPFYIETWWQIAENPQPKLVKDCFPKKLTIEQNNLLHRHICLQGVVEDVRNRMDRIEQMLINLTSQSKEFIMEKRQESLASSQRNIRELDLKEEENL